MLFYMHTLCQKKSGMKTEGFIVKCRQNLDLELLEGKKVPINKKLYCKVKIIMLYLSYSILKKV